jgi:hypothetical protein
MAKATISYLLSAEGQKAAIASELSAAREQTSEVDVSNGDLALFDVDKEGNLSASAEQGWERINTWSSSWKEYAFDVPPSQDDLLIFLRQRVTERVRVEQEEIVTKEAKRLEEETKKQSAIEFMLARIQSANAQGIEDGLTLYPKISYEDGTYYDCVGTSDCELSVNQYQAAAEFATRVHARKDAEEEKAARLKAIKDAAPRRAKGRDVTPAEDGKLLFTCPDSTLPGEWAKHVISVDPEQKGGYALEGPWLKVNEQFTLTAGDIIVVGGKEWQGSKRRGSFIYESAVYIITTTGVRSMGRWDKTAAAVTKVASLLKMTPKERCKIALEKAIAIANKYLVALGELDPTVYADEYADEIETRISEWTELQQECERALTNKGKGGTIKSVSDMAADIIAEGFRVLAEQHQTSGDTASLALLNEARNTLIKFLNSSLSEISV